MSLEERYPEVEISAEDFKYVERLFPAKTVPKPPEHESYPTPSGWFPPDSKLIFFLFYFIYFFLTQLHEMHGAIAVTPVVHVPVPVACARHTCVKVF